MTEPYIQTSGGLSMPLLTPKPGDIDIRGMIYALAHLNRYTGHAGVYSVAEHCVLGCLAMARDGYNEENQLAFLFHDAHEAYTGDVSQPVKKALDAIAPGVWAKFEKIHMDNMERFVGIEVHRPVVHMYDVEMLIAETNVLFDRRVGEGWPRVPPTDTPIYQWDGPRAASEYTREVLRLAPYLLNGGAK